MDRPHPVFPGVDSIERISARDGSLLGGWAESLQRLEMALPFCKDRRVLDAGCGSGYAAHFVALNGAREVLGIDYSQDAIQGAQQDYQRPNLQFKCVDLQLPDTAGLPDQSFDVVLHIETLPHLENPERFLACARRWLAPSGTLIASVPNGEVIPIDTDGKPAYRYQHRAYTAPTLAVELQKQFNEVSLYGQWLTHSGKLRKARERAVFAQLSEMHYHPAFRVWRGVRRLFGKSVPPPPRYSGESDSYPGDYQILPLSDATHPWPPSTLLAICSA